MSSFFGLETLIENASNLWGTGKKVKEQDRENAYTDMMRNERGGIQARVEGAKAAGLHPLAALGFQAGNSPMIPVGSRVDPFQAPASDPKVDEEMRQAQIRNLNAQAAEAESRALASTRALAKQPGNPPAYPTEPENLIPGQGSSINGVKVKPNEIVASRGGVEVGMQPTEARGRGTDGFVWKGLSDWGLKQTEDMELLRLGLFSWLNRTNILDKIGFNDLKMNYRLQQQKEAQDANDKSEARRELIRLINRSRARDRQR